MEIIKFDEKMKEEFYKWAEKYIRSAKDKDLSEYPVEHILCKLAVSGILTLDEIRKELDRENIPLQQFYFDKAAWLIENIGKNS